jgi:hypothetical protein
MKIVSQWNHLQRHIVDATDVLKMPQWCYSGVTVVLQWCYSGVTVVLQWRYSGVTVVSQWESGVTECMLYPHEVQNKARVAEGVEVQHITNATIRDTRAVDRDLVLVAPVVHALLVINLLAQTELVVVL